jgi:cytochrome P450
VFVCNAALLEEICDPTRFRKCVTGPVVEMREAVHDALFTAYDSEAMWGVAHRIMAPLLTPEAVKANFNEQRDTVAKLVSRWTASPGKKVNVLVDLQRIDLQECMLCMFGQDMNCLDGPKPPMVQAMHDSTMEAMKRPTRPKLLNNWIYKSSFDKPNKVMRDFAADALAYYRSHQVSRNDLLNALINHKDPETGKGLTESQIIDEIVTPLIGSSTSPCLLAFAVYYLTQNPHVVAKAREEIDTVIGPGNEFEFSHLSKLKYCEAIFRESLRLSAAAPGFNIEPLPSTTGDVSLAGGEYIIPKNQVMIAVLASVNRDPEVFEDPLAFNPERMLGEKYDNYPSSVKKGFGNGKRECIGKNYARQWCLISLVSLLRSVDFALADKSYQLAMDGAFNMEIQNFFALVGPRKG